jgi:hypothetical protein
MPNETVVFDIFEYFFRVFLFFLVTASFSQKISFTVNNVCATSHTVERCVESQHWSGTSGDASSRRRSRRRSRQRQQPRSR